MAGRPTVPPETGRATYSRPFAAAMRRADGFIVLAQRQWEMLGAHHRLGGRPFVAPNGVVVAVNPSAACGRPTTRRTW